MTPLQTGCIHQIHSRSLELLNCEQNSANGAMIYYKYESIAMAIQSYFHTPPSMAALYPPPHYDQYPLLIPIKPKAVLSPSSSSILTTGHALTIEMTIAAIAITAPTLIPRYPWGTPPCDGTAYRVPATDKYFSSWSEENLIHICWDYLDGPRGGFYY